MPQLFASSLVSEVANVASNDEIIQLLARLHGEVASSNGIWFQATIDDAQSGDEANDIDGESERMDAITGFFAPDPDSALRWMCDSTKKSRLLKRIRDIYRDLDSEEGQDNSEGISPIPRARRAGGGSNTRTSNQKAREKALSKFAHGWANSQAEELQSVTEISDKDLAHASFLSSYPRLGEKIAGEMVRRASVVATWDAIEDWSVIMRYWRGRFKQDRNQLDALTQPMRVVYDTDDENEDQEMDGAAEGEEGWGLATAPRSPLGTLRYTPKSARTLYFAVLNSEASESMTVLRNRWLCSYFYQTVQQRERVLRTDGIRSGRQGVTLNTLAKESMFQEFYRTEQHGKQFDRFTHAREWDDLSRILERGSRWAEFESSFGLGIFLLLGYSKMPNVFVEKTLHVDQVKIWVKLLEHSNPDLKDMCKRVNPIFQACMSGNPPPEEQLQLEQVHDWIQIRRSSTVDSMFEPCEPIV